MTRTAVVIGYSLNDPDIRQLWQIIAMRLDKLRRPAYCFMVGSTSDQVARFQRRGVQVIEFGDGRTGTDEEMNTYRAEVFEMLFKQLRDYFGEHLIRESTITVDSIRRELSFPREIRTRLCFFAVPTQEHAYYRDFIYPLIERAGFVPVVEEDIVSSGGNLAAEIDVLIERASLVVVHFDETSPDVAVDLKLALAKNKNILVVQANNDPDAGDVKLSLHLASAGLDGLLEALRVMVDNTEVQLDIQSDLRRVVTGIIFGILRGSTNSYGAILNRILASLIKANPGEVARGQIREILEDSIKLVRQTARDTERQKEVIALLENALLEIRLSEPLIAPNSTQDTVATPTVLGGPIVRRARAPVDPYRDSSVFVTFIRQWLRDVRSQIEPTLASQPQRVLDTNVGDAADLAVIASVSLICTISLRFLWVKFERRPSATHILVALIGEELVYKDDPTMDRPLSKTEFDKIEKWWRRSNEILRDPRSTPFTRQEAEEARDLSGEIYVRLKGILDQRTESVGSLERWFRHPGSSNPVQGPSSADITSEELAILAQQGKAFDWLEDEPDLYTISDGEPV